MTKILFLTAAHKDGKIAWKPEIHWAIPVALIGAFSLFFLIRVNAFIYFQF